MSQMKELEIVTRIRDITERIASMKDSERSDSSLYQLLEEALNEYTELRRGVSVRR